MRIALDAMGGDSGPPCLVEGARLALDKDNELEVSLVGRREELEPLIERFGPFPEGRCEIVHASEAVDMHTTAKESLRMKDSSLAVGARLVKDGAARGLVSAGNTAATKAATLMTWRQLPGIHRPAIASHLPTRKAPCIFLDMGATVDCKPRNLFHFAIMGSVFAEEVVKIANPRVALLSIGEEASKGHDLIFQTSRLLSEARGLNFVGNAEGGDIVSGEFDVVVADGFVGNVALKMAESIGSWVIDELKSTITRNFLTRIAGLTLKPLLMDFKKKADYAEYGGAPLLGLNGVCIICHGRSCPRAISRALRVAREYAAHDVNKQILERLELNAHLFNGVRQEESA